MEWSSRASDRADDVQGHGAWLRAEALAGAAVSAVQPATEFALLLGDPVFWGWGVPRGDGHAVLVLPGLFGGDRYLQPLRGWLRRIGYAAVRSELDRNPGWSEKLVRELGEIAQRECDSSGRRVTIIGHSMGGVLGRSIAARRPDLVRHVIALGSPLAMSRSRLPESVRLTAIYSPDDGVVRAPNARAREPWAQNIEVRGSHIGLAGNPAVYRHLATLLPKRHPRAL